MKFSETIEARLSGRHLMSLEFVGDLRGRKVLDVGCSVGMFEKLAVEAGCTNIVGIEPSGANFRFVSPQISHAQFVEASALDLPFLDAHFDIVIMFDVLEHLPKDSETQALREIQRVLRDDGKLVISTPNQSLWSNLLDPAWYFGHRHYSLKRLKVLLEKTGFKIEAVRYGGSFFEMFTMIIFYFFKWIMKSEIPFKAWFDKKRTTEYSTEKGFSTIFVRAVPAQATDILMRKKTRR